jgi:hypothetical protein
MPTRVISMKRSAWLVGLVVGLCAAEAAAAPSFKDRMEANKLGAEAKRAAAQKDHKTAAKKYKKADELIPAPSYKLELAKMLVELEDLVQAAEVLQACMDQGPIQQWIEKRAQTQCIEMASKLDDRIPRLTIDVFKPSADQVTVKIDGDEHDPAEGELRFNPGSYEIVATAQGFKTFRKKVVLAEGDRESVEISLKGGPVEKKPVEEEDDDDGGLSPVPAYVAWGLGAVGLGVGIGFGIAAIQTTNNVVELYGCEDNECPPEAEEDIAVAQLNGNLSTAGFIVGGVGIAGGTILYLLADTGDDEDESGADSAIEATPMVGPGFVGVNGKF